MFAKYAALAAMLLAGCAPASAQVELPAGTPLPEFFAQCQDKDGWTDPAPPIRLYGNVYDVGTCGIVALLIVGDEGHVLIDSGPAEAAPLVAANIRKLGYALDEVKWIVSSHEHHDHVGGVAELHRLTGAKVAANAAAKRQLETGTLEPTDPQAGLLDPYPAIRVDRVLHDGDTLTLGSLTLTMHATPGHAPGSTSWSWRTCEGETCHKVALADSVSAVSADAYRFSDHPDYVATFRGALDAIAKIDCDLVITPHPGASQLYEKLAGDAPLAYPDACRKYAQWGREQLDARLAREAAGG